MLLDTCFICRRVLRCQALLLLHAWMMIADGSSSWMNGVLRSFHCSTQNPPTTCWATAAHRCSCQLTTVQLRQVPVQLRCNLFQQEQAMLQLQIQLKVQARPSSKARQKVCHGSSLKRPQFQKQWMVHCGHLCSRCGNQLYRQVCHNRLHVIGRAPL